VSIYQRTRRKPWLEQMPSGFSSSRWKSDGRKCRSGVACRWLDDINASVGVLRYLDKWRIMAVVSCCLSRANAGQSRGLHGGAAGSYHDSGMPHLILVWRSAQAPRLLVIGFTNGQLACAWFTKSTAILQCTLGMKATDSQQRVPHLASFAFPTSSQDCQDHPRNETMGLGELGHGPETKT
jgi:hypothetical protein